MPRLAALLVAAGVLLAGCSGDPGAGAAGTPAASEEAPAMLQGLVLTQAIVPIAGANVTVRPGDLSNTTDAEGRFLLGPLAPGLYELTVSADGYATTSVGGVVVPDGGVAPDEVKMLLAALREDVPYIELQKFDGYLQCTFDTWVAPYQILGAPCFGIIDIVTGQQVSQDQWQFEFAIDAPGLAGILVEMFWEDQPTGSHMGMLLRNVAGAGSGVDAGGTNVDTQYASARGPAPLQMRVLQGVENNGSDDGAAFQVPQNETMTYKVLILGRADYDRPADVHLMVNNRPEVYVTEFYHAMGGQDYSVANA